MWGFICIWIERDGSITYGSLVSVVEADNVFQGSNRG